MLLFYLFLSFLILIIADTNADTNNRQYSFHVDVTTIVGGGIDGSTAGDTSTSTGPGILSLFNTISGLGLDVNNQVMCVTDLMAYEVRLVDLATDSVKRLGGQAGKRGYLEGPATVSRYDRPSGCATVELPNDVRRTYVSDSGNCGIRIILDTYSGWLSGGPTPPIPRIGVPLVCGAGQDGTLSKNVRWSKFIGTPIITPHNNLWVLDTGNAALRLVSLGTDDPNYERGGTLTVAGMLQQVGTVDGVGNAARFTSPTIMTWVESMSTLFIVDQDKIRSVVAPTDDEWNGQYQVSTIPLTLVDPISGTPFSPMGIAVDVKHNITYLTTSTNDVYAAVMKADGLFDLIRIAGGDTPGVQDGVGLTARFNQPADIQIQSDAASNNTLLYINDAGNNKIRMLNITLITSGGG